MFNERHDKLTHFVLKDNELYRWPLDLGQAESRMVFDYNFAKIIEKVYRQHEYAGNSKTFAKIKQFYYGMKKQMVEYLLKRY